MLEFARQGSFVQLVKVNKLDQVREFGVPVVKAEEHLSIILALERHKDTCRVRGCASGNKTGPTVSMSSVCGPVPKSTGSPQGELGNVRVAGGSQGFLLDAEKHGWRPFPRWLWGGS